MQSIMRLVAKRAGSRAARSCSAAGLLTLPDDRRAIGGLGLDDLPAADLSLNPVWNVGNRSRGLHPSRMKGKAATARALELCGWSAFRTPSVD
jgi:hypothetical protein